MPRLLIRMDDRPDKPKAAIVCSPAEAKRFNDDEHCNGVFCTVNSFVGTVRRKDELERICAWPIDIDDGTKTEQHDRLLASPLVPSVIVETKRGFQAYWFAREALPEHWNAIVLERLVPHFGADKNARDLCRILRVPGYWHFKDPADPFLIRTVWEHQVVYSERQMAEAFRWVPDVKANAEQRVEAKKATGTDHGEDFWAAIGNLDCRDALERLSGHSVVNGEQFTFQRTARGTWNILADGKGTSCWVDADGKIGSSDKGGPWITNWIRWYRASWKEAIEAVMSVYPHIREIDERNKVRDRAAWVEQQRKARCA